MKDERALIARLEAANTDDLAHLILFATPDEEKVLRVYLGDARFRRLRNLVLRREMARSERRTEQRENVVVIPGVLGSELTAVDRAQRRERLWLSSHQIIAGHLERLRLDAQGLAEANTDYSIRDTGIMKRYYGELMLSLAEHYNVQAFWYDWRKDFRLAAAQLQARIDSWFPAGEPVHLVAHADGGLVARAYLHQFPARWELGGSKLIMIGTPNYGIYTAAQAITGHLELIRWIDLLDTQHDRADFREIIKSFPSLYQLLPNPKAPLLPVAEAGEEIPTADALYSATAFGPELNVSQTHLDQARSFHALLDATQVDPQRMIYIAGHGQPTFVGIHLQHLHKFHSRGLQSEEDERNYLNRTYTIGLNGDGSTPHHLGVLKTADGQRIPAYYVEALHGDLCAHPKVLLGIQALLRGATDGALQRASGLQRLTDNLIDLPPRKSSAGVNGKVEQAIAEATPLARAETEKEAFKSLMRRVTVRSGDTPSRHLVSSEERDIEERLTYGFLSGANGITHETYHGIHLAQPTIKINVVRSDITDNQLQVDSAACPVDAIALGHYNGSKPHGILRTLDVKISRALEGVFLSDDDENNFEELSTLPAEDADLLLTQYAQRGTLRGELAQTFFLADPRQPARVIAVAGMGEPGRFGVPELSVLVRELCWALGRMGKQHLATVLIGSGRDNLSVANAVAGWIRGIKLALSGMSEAPKSGKRPCILSEITFFIMDPQKVLDFDGAILREIERLTKRNRMEVRYTKLTKARKTQLADQAIAYVQERMKQQQTSERPKEPAPTRITVSVAGHTYRFGAITEQASIPEREIPLDPALVRRANDELAAASDPTRQLDLGQFMERLLIPADLRSQLATSAPLVMMLDATTARIHWELLAQTNLASSLSQTLAGVDDERVQFLGISRGFTRQLRTGFAPPPEPPPPSRRHLRVLVVADPAEDAHLDGAEEEGIAVADLFEQFNIVHAHSGNRVEVVRLFGPREATRTAVMRHLMLRTYDVLHFAGHCFYNKQDPAASGWLFSNKELLSAYEFTRIDRSPAFVFSNACESGITPARADERSVELAPSFAESFFARGVTNFVCTAWPVEDRAARDFALTLYAGLLGMTCNGGAKSKAIGNGTAYNAGQPLPMYEAMQRARIAIAAPPSDGRTWGAYQHYGNPYYRFFDPSGMNDAAAKQTQQPVVSHQAATNGVGPAQDQQKAAKNSTTKKGKVTS
ncbi:MAG: CHAT domain-containing protein [Caldilineaceae bacterium]